MAASKTTETASQPETKNPTSEPEGTETMEPAATSRAETMEPERLEKETPQAEMARALREAGGQPATTADMPDVPMTDDPRAHGPSSQGQASAAEQTLAAASATAHSLVVDALPADQRAEADDNEIERTTRAMAAAGHTAGEIAAYRAEAFARLGD